MAPSLKTLYSFTGIDDPNGALPESGVLIDPVTGDLYGTDTWGGADDLGAMFRIDFDDDAYDGPPTLVFSGGAAQGFGFHYGDFGLPLTADASGNVYALNNYGGPDLGPNNDAVLFKISPDGVETVLTSFGVGNDITGPIYSGVAVDPSGNLVGVGKSPKDDVLFEVNSVTGAVSDILTPNAANDDIVSGTEGPLLILPNGNIFATNAGNAAHPHGAIYEVAYDDGVYSTTAKLIAEFDGVHGDFPADGVIADAQGNLFGIADRSSNSYASEIFEIKNVDGVYASTPTVLAKFTADTLLMDAAGDLFGTAAYGGANTKGYVFELAKTNGVYAKTPKTLATFDGANGAVAYGALSVDKAGDLFGTTYNGGADDDGTVFEITDSGFVVTAPSTYDVADALALATSDPPTPVHGGVVLDTAANIVTLSPDLLTALADDGFVKITASDSGFDFSLGQADAVEADKLTVTTPSGSPAAVSDSAALIDALTPDQLAALKQGGFTELKASDAPLKITAAEALAAADDDIKLFDPQGVALDDTAANIEALTAAQYVVVLEDGVNELEAKSSTLALTVAQALAAVDNGVGKLVDDNSQPIEISDTAAAILGLSSAQLLKLAEANVSRLAANDGDLVATIAGVTDIVDAHMTVSVPSGFKTRIEADASDIDALSVDQLGAAAAAGFKALASSSGDLLFSVAQAKAATAGGMTVSSTAPDLTAVSDTAAALEALTTEDIVALGEAGFQYLVAGDAGVVLDVDQASALVEETSLIVQAPDGQLVQLADKAQAIEGLSAFELAAIVKAGVTSIASNDIDLFLTVDQALALLDASVVVDAPDGFYARVHDMSQALQALTADQIAQLGGAGFSYLESTSGPLTLDVAQAVAVIDAKSIIVAVPEGFVAQLEDTGDALASLTPEDLAGLEEDGFTDLASSQGDLDLTVEQALAVATTSSMQVAAPEGASATVYDTAAEVETLTPEDISALADHGFARIESADGDLLMSVEQAQAIEAQEGLSVAAPDGAHAAVFDSAANIEALTLDQIEAIAKIGFDVLSSDDADLVFNLTVAVAILAIGDVILAAPEGFKARLEDTASALDGIDPAFIAKLGETGVTEIAANDARLIFDVAQALAVEADAVMTVSAPDDAAVVIQDTAAALEALTADQIAGLVKDGFQILQSEAGGLDFTAAQAKALAQGLMPLGFEGAQARVVDDAASLASLSAADIAAIARIGVNALVSNDATVQFTVAQAQAIAADETLVVSAPSGRNVTVADSAAALETLSAEQIAALAKAGVDHFEADGGELDLSVEQAQAIAGTLVSSPGEPIAVFDVAAAFQDLSGDQIENLITSGFDELVASDSDLKLTADQALAAAAGGEMKVLADGAAIVSDGAAALQALTTDEIAKLGEAGFTKLAADDEGLALSVDQAQAIVEAQLDVAAPTDTAVEVYGDPSAIAQLTPDRIATLADVGFTQIAAESGDLTLTVAQAQAVVEAKTLSLAAPDEESSAFVADSASALAALSADQIAALGKAGVAALTTPTDVLDLTVAQALALDAAGMTVSAPAGAAVVDTPDALAALSPGQIDAVAKDGFDALSATGGDLRLSVAQALAADSAGLSLGAVVVYDVNSALDALSPSQIGALADDGVTELFSSAGALSLSVAQTLAIEDAGLAIDANASPVAGIVDTAANVAADFDKIDAESRISSILMTDPGTPALTLTNAQVVDDTRALSEIANVKYVVEAPAISGAVAGQATTSEAPVAPFAGVTITDANPGATETLTITLSGAGGVLSGDGLADGGDGVYTLAGSTADVTADVRALTFTPSVGADGTSSTTTFALSNASSAFSPPSTDATTTVVDTDPTGGVAEDGYIFGATVTYASGLGASATTDARGRFTLSGGTGPLILQGGVDTSTGLAFAGAWKTVNGASVISPLTTLLVDVADLTGDTISQANAAVLTGLGLTGATDLTTYDAEAGVLAGEPAATAVFEAQAGVQSLISLIQSLAGASGARAAMSAVASLLVSAGSAAQTSLVATAATAAGLDAAQSDAIGAILSATNAALATQLAGSPSATTIYADVGGAELDVQGNAATALAGAADDASTSAVASTYAQGLSGTLADADARVATPSAPTITSPSDLTSISNAQPVITGTGGAGDTVTVSIDGAVAGTTQVAADGDWSFTPGSALGNAGHMVTATETNVADVASPVSAAIAFTVSATGLGFGDVHITTFDGLRYDFQAVGAYVLARSTVAGDDFQIQIETAPYAPNHAASVTTAVAAQVGADVVTFAAGRIELDGAAISGLSAATPLVMADGELTQLSPSEWRLEWNSGQTLTIDDRGANFDTSVGLGAQNAPGSVQGLLGSDTGQANDFAIPDGTILKPPVSQADLLGEFARAWSVSQGASLFGASHA